MSWLSVEDTKSFLRTARNGDRFLKSLQAGRALIVFDFDDSITDPFLSRISDQLAGNISIDSNSAIVEAQPSFAALRGIRMLAATTPACVMTGRRLDFLTKRFQIPSLHIVGSFGSHWVHNGRSGIIDEFERARPRIETALDRVRATARLQPWWHKDMRIFMSGGFVRVDWREVQLEQWDNPPEFERRVAATRTAVANYLSGIGEDLNLLVHPAAAGVRLAAPEVNKRSATHALVQRLGSDRVEAAMFIGNSEHDLDGFRALDDLETSLNVPGVRVLVDSRDITAKLIATADLRVPTSLLAGELLENLGIIARRGIDLSGHLVAGPSLD